MSGTSQQKNQATKKFTIPAQFTAKELGKVNVNQEGDRLNIDFSIRVVPAEMEGYQTGVALDASASMMEWYGQLLKGTIPGELYAKYKKDGLVLEAVEDGQKTMTLKQAALDDAMKSNHLAQSENIIEPIARRCISYLAGELDADGGTTVIYWACDDGGGVEPLGDFTKEQCTTLNLTGPSKKDFGTGTHLTSAFRFFEEKFRDAKRGMYLFLTDGRLDDLDEVKAFTTDLARKIEGGKRNPVKCILVGIGGEIDEKQMIELDDLDTGTEVDIWDHKVGASMHEVVAIFDEIVDENQIVADNGVIYDSGGRKVATFTDGLPAKVAFSMPADSAWFELQVGEVRIRQTVTPPIT